MALTIIVSAHVRFWFLMRLPRLVIRFIIGINPPPLQTAVALVVPILLCIAAQAPKSDLRLLPLLGSKRSIMIVGFFDDVFQESGIRFGGICCWPRSFRLKGLRNCLAGPTSLVVKH